MRRFKRLVLTSLDSPRRDFEWRLFLASRLARYGISSAIGSKSSIKKIQKRSRNAILFGRLSSAAGRSQSDRLWLESFNPSNTKWVFFHDEGGIYPEWIYEQNVRRAYPEQFFKESYMSKVCFWGARQEQLFSDHEYSHKFEVVGAPRFDLMRKAHDPVDANAVKALRDRYGSFTLICARFNAANRVGDEPHALNKRFRDILVEAGIADHSEHPDVIRQQFKRWNRVAHEFPEFMCGIAELLIQNPESKFVIRPHPTEKASVYQEAFESFGNAYIDKSGDVRPFIRAANCVIHSECTTGLEAAVNEKPVINFRPWFGDENLGIAGMSEVGSVCRNAEDLVQLYRKVCHGGEANAWSDWSMVSNIVHNAPPGQPEATTAIAKTIKEVSDRMHWPTELSPPEGFAPARLARRGLSLGKRVLSLPFGQKIEGAMKFGEVDADTKAYRYSPDVVEDLWCSFEGPGKISIKDGTVWVFAG
ncbi:MAG: surface carbohydrate biosynthesis protein [Wenzhouxiangella sp.]